MGKQQIINGGSVVAENCRSQQNAGDDFTEHRRLVEFLDQFSSKFSASQKSTKCEEDNHDIMWRQMIHGVRPRESRWMPEYVAESPSRQCRAGEPLLEMLLRNRWGLLHHRVRVIRLAGRTRDCTVLTRPSCGSVRRCPVANSQGSFLPAPQMG